jgi:hypothetical protein
MRWGDGTRGVEEDLPELAGQVAAPRKGRRRGQGMVLEPDPDHVMGNHRPGQPDRPRPVSADDGGAGQHRGGPVRGRAKTRFIGSECRSGGSVNSKRGSTVRRTRVQAS